MKAANFLRILVVTLGLSAYSVWLLSYHQNKRSFGPTRPQEQLVFVYFPRLQLADAEALWQKPTTIFLDVRPERDFQAGHIQGALSLPEEDFETRFPELESQLREAEEIVVYCKSIDCGKSDRSAMRLRHQGILPIKIYPKGWDEWNSHGLPSTRAGAER